MRYWIIGFSARFSNAIPPRTLQTKLPPSTRPIPQSFVGTYRMWGQSTKRHSGGRRNQGQSISSNGRNRGAEHRRRIRDAAMLAKCRISKSQGSVDDSAAASLCASELLAAKWV